MIMWFVVLQVIGFRIILKHLTLFLDRILLLGICSGLESILLLNPSLDLLLLRRHVRLLITDNQWDSAV